jgi:hypothetical protein
MKQQSSQQEVCKLINEGNVEKLKLYALQHSDEFKDAINTAKNIAIYNVAIYNALHHALYNNYADIVAFLASYGMKISSYLLQDTTTSDGTVRSLLKKGHIEMLRCLASLGVNIAASVNNQVTWDIRAGSLQLDRFFQFISDTCLLRFGYAAC